jgi:multiple sugar transport system permease protein
MTGIVVNNRPGVDPDHPEATRLGRRGAKPSAGRSARPTRFLVGATCVAISTVMVLPLVASVLASVKPVEEASRTPPTYVPHGLSFDAYRRLWDYQSGLPTYFTNSLFTALLTVLFTLVLTILAGYGLARFPVPLKELLFVVLLLALIIPYQALLTPVFLILSDVGLTNSLIGLALVHTTIQFPFSLYVMRNSFEAVPKSLEEAAMIDGANSLQILRRLFIPAAVPAIITVALFAFIMSWNEYLTALVLMNRDANFTLPLILASARTETSLGGTDWGMLQAGITISIVPCVAVYLLLQRYFVAGFLTGAVK